MSSAKRVPTPDVIDLMSDNLRNHIVEVIWPNPYGFRDIADALEAQRDQLQQAREIIDALNRLRHLSSGSAIIARLDPILEKAAAFKRANPAPAATKE